MSDGKVGEGKGGVGGMGWGLPRVGGASMGSGGSRDGGGRGLREGRRYPTHISFLSAASNEGLLALLSPLLPLARQLEVWGKGRKGERER